MADRRRDRIARRTRIHKDVDSAHILNDVVDTLPNIGASNGKIISPLVAATQLLSDVDSRYQQRYESWQDEAWDFYASLGEFNYGVEWFGEALSRVRLHAALVSPENDEPEPLKEGLASDLIASLCNGTDGQSQIMRSLGVQLSVAGDAFFIGREVTEDDYYSGTLLDAEPDDNGRVWTVNPVNTVRQSSSGIRSLLRRGTQRRQWEIQVEDSLWIKLPEESLVCRVWDRNERFPWLAMSPARPALPIMREIDMYNRQVIASLLSRIALNGMLLIPDEVVLPASSQYENAADPFMAELIDIMRAAIKNPGAPSSAAPVPLRIPAEYIDKVKHITFATPLDERLFEQRDQALRRLATTLNLPAEILTGLGDSNHWSAWHLTESAIKFHIVPKVEIITRCLTIGYLHPMLRAAGELTRINDSRIIVWYDTSELTQRPDRSNNAIKLRDMLIISDRAVRRETGFNESDAPTTDELEEMILKKLAVTPQTASPALKNLTGLNFTLTTAQSTSNILSNVDNVPGSLPISDVNDKDLPSTGAPEREIGYLRKTASTPPEMHDDTSLLSSLL